MRKRDGRLLVDLARIVLAWQEVSRYLAEATREPNRA